MKSNFHLLQVFQYTVLNSVSSVKYHGDVFVLKLYAALLSFQPNKLNLFWPKKRERILNSQFEQK